MKKLLATGVAVATLLVTASPALAWHWSKPTVTNTAVVSQTGSSVANTGYNAQTKTGWSWGSGSLNMTTGPALAETQVAAVVTQNDCGCVLPGVKTLTNTAQVTQVGASVANTGYNAQYGKGTLNMTTGGAMAGTVVSAVVTQ